VGFEWLSFEGDPIATVQLAANRDLVITGHDTAFEKHPRRFAAPAAAAADALPNDHLRRPNHAGRWDLSWL
jgi:hypothetical protein